MSEFYLLEFYLDGELFASRARTVVPSIGDEVRFCSVVYRIINKVFIYDETMERIAFDIVEVIPLKTGDGGEKDLLDKINYRHLNQMTVMYPSSVYIMLFSDGSGRFTDGENVFFEFGNINELDRHLTPRGSDRATPEGNDGA